MWGFGSVRDIYLQANKKYSNIKLEDVKDYFKNKDFKQVKFTYRKFNSCLPSYFLQETQIDLAVMTEDEQGFKYALCGIDIFSRYAHAVP